MIKNFTDQQIEQAYNLACERYAAAGVDSRTGAAGALRGLAQPALLAGRRCGRL